MATADTVEQGRRAFADRAWSKAYAALQDATEPQDLERLATAARLVGEDDAGQRAMERAHHAFLERGDAPGAARCAFWLAMWLFDGGEHARGGGWLARAHTVVGDAECVERGFLLLPAALQALPTDAAQAYDTFAQALEIAQRFGDADLTALARLGQGQALLRSGETVRGLALLDEDMVAVEAGEVAPLPSGIIYCAVISACAELADYRRAQQWTQALTRWCDAQPDMVPFRGQCLVHRSQILQVHGAWSDALQEALRACTQYRDDHPAIGAAHYQRGEVHRLRGDADAAEEAYRHASAAGHTPQPGLALLRLAQGHIEAARAGIERALDNVADPLQRPSLLAAHAEVALADEDVATARAAADELTAIAATVGTAAMQAVADHIRGAVLLVADDARHAAVALQRAAGVWRELDAPYEAARARVLVGLACRRLGDHDSAVLELEAARATFERLGARADLDRLGRLLPTTRDAAGGLTDRELEVLRLIAAGKTNRDIAEQLVISTHTVARHVQNIFTKLDVASRTAAAAFAFEHDLL